MNSGFAFVLGSNFNYEAELLSRKTCTQHYFCFCAEAATIKLVDLCRTFHFYLSLE